MDTATHAQVDSQRNTLPPLERLVTADGFTLGARVFKPRNTPRATLLVNPGTAIPQRFYARFAQHAAERGFRVVTFDFRGIGESRPRSLRGFDATMTQWAQEDSASALAFARTFGDPVFLVGHSFGGQSVGLTDALSAVDGAVFVAAQFGFYRHWPMLAQPRLAAIWYGVVPSATGLFGYLPGQLGMGEDLPSGVAREWARWCTSPGYLTADHPESRRRFAEFSAPTVLYSFTDDDYAPRGAVDAFIDRFAPGRVLHRRVRPSELGVGSVGHFGFFRVKQGGALWNEALSFVEDVLSGRDPRLASKAVAEPMGIGLRELMGDLRAGRED